MTLALAVAAVLWGAVVLARPRRPMGTDETLWLVYRRAMGGMERVLIAAVLATMIAFFLTVCTLATASDRDLARLRNPCVDGRGDSVCWRLGDDGNWRLERVGG